MTKTGTTVVKNAFIFSLIGVLFAVPDSYSQVTGFLEDFNDNVLTGWQVPQATHTFALSEQDSVLKIIYNRTAISWEWDNFNFTPPLIDVSHNPYISLQVKSSIATELTLKPIYQNGNNDWLQKWIAGDNLWHSVTFDLVASAGSAMNRIYFYLDGGTTTPKSGIVLLDNLAIGDSVNLTATPDYAQFQEAIRAARALYEGTDEGNEEGRYPPGSKSVLLSAVEQAEELLRSGNLTKETIDQAMWDLSDACETYEKGVNAPDYGLVDQQATIKTRYLYANLALVARENLIFGMHDATGYGVGWSGDDNRSDVKDVCGDYPALYSWDMNKITRKIDLERVIYRITSSFERGGIETLCWHQYDPLGRGFYASDVNNERIVTTLLPGGKYHDRYKDKLHQIARVMKALRGSDGHAIPIIFRPYHEHDGTWFWWGVTHCTSEEYNQLWRFTVAYLRDSLNVHNLLYALSPSKFTSQEDYLEPYPGHEWVDVIGMDFYFGYPVSPGERNDFRKRLQIVVQIADENNKIAALTEVGQEGIKTSNLFTQEILSPLKNDSLARNITYAAVWRNANTTHHFAPYPGDPSVPDFLLFYNDPYTLFERDLPDMYGKPGVDAEPPFFTRLPQPDFVATDTAVTIQLITNERAFLRYSLNDEPYETMPFSFEHGQGGREHSTTIHGVQGMHYEFYVRAADYSGNVMDTSAVISFRVDTLEAPVSWTGVRYEDKYWPRGKAPLGYGNSGTDSTEINPSITVYFRHTFVLTDSVAALGLLLKGHDGAVAFVNGHEIGRVDMPAGDIDNSTKARNPLAFNKIFVFDTSALSALRIGQNVLAVEVHQAETLAPNISFDARLFSPNGFVVDLGSYWRYYDREGGPGVQTIGGIQSATAEAFSPYRPCFRLWQNYPNPFNPATTISYQLPTPEKVDLSVYNTLGQKVLTLVQGKQTAGFHQVTFYAGGLPAGIYLYRVRAGDYSECKKLVVMK